MVSLVAAPSPPDPGSAHSVPRVMAPPGARRCAGRGSCGIVKKDEKKIVYWVGRGSVDPVYWNGFLAGFSLCLFSCVEACVPNRFVVVLCFDLVGRLGGTAP